MLVEDEAMLAMLLEGYLEDLGCEIVHSASRLPDAMRTAEVAALDAAVLDLNLAGVLSYPVAEILRNRGVWLVFATGYGMAGLRSDFGDVPVLAKPFNLAQLAKVLLPALGTRGSTPG